jgi:hypothetical protein
MNTEQNRISASGARQLNIARRQGNRSGRKAAIAAALACACGLAMPHPATAQGYQFTNFDGTGDHTGGTTINGINNFGIEVGFSTNADGNFTNFLRNPDGSFVTLSALPAAAQANGVNTDKTVVGTDGAGNAFSLSLNTVTTLPNASPGNISQVAFGINDGGKIVGQYLNALGNMPGFLDNGGSFTLYSPTATATITNVQGINNKDQAIGFYSADGVHQHGFLWNTDTNATTLFADPNTARIAADGLVLTQFLGINANGEAVGYYQTNNGSQFGFLFNTMTDTYTYLDDPQAAPVNGVQITQITGIDNQGDLSGFYVDPNGVQRGFFATAVPEPGSVALMIGMGLSGIGLLARRRRPRA